MQLNQEWQKNNSQSSHSKQLNAPKLIHNLAPIRNQNHPMCQSYKFQDKCNTAMHDPELAGGSSMLKPELFVNGREFDERTDSKSKIKIRMYGSKKSLWAYTAVLPGNQSESKFVSEYQGRTTSLIHAETSSHSKRPASTSQDRNKKKVFGCKQKLPPSLTMIDQNTRTEINYNRNESKTVNSPKKNNFTLKILSKEPNKGLKKHALSKPKVIGRQIKISAQIDEISPEFEKINRLKMEHIEQITKQKHQQNASKNSSKSREAQNPNFNEKIQIQHDFNIDQAIQAQKKFLYEAEQDEARDSAHFGKSNTKISQKNENKVSQDLMSSLLFNEYNQMRASNTIKEVNSQNSDYLTFKLLKDKNFLHLPKIPSVILTPNKKIKAHFDYVDSEKSPRARHGHFLEQKNPVRVLILNKTTRASTNFINQQGQEVMIDANHIFGLKDSNMIQNKQKNEQKIQFPEIKKKSEKNQQLKLKSLKLDQNIQKKPSIVIDSNKNMPGHFQFIDFNDSFSKLGQDKKTTNNKQKIVLSSVKSIDAYFEYINDSGTYSKDEEYEEQLREYMKREIDLIIQFQISRQSMMFGCSNTKLENIFSHEEVPSSSSIQLYKERFQNIEQAPKDQNNVNNSQRPSQEQMEDYDEEYQYFPVTNQQDSIKQVQLPENRRLSQAQKEEIKMQIDTIINEHNFESLGLHENQSQKIGIEPALEEKYSLRFEQEDKKEQASQKLLSSQNLLKIKQKLSTQNIQDSGEAKVTSQNRWLHTQTQNLQQQVLKGPDQNLSQQIIIHNQKLNQVVNEVKNEDLSQKDLQNRSQGQKQIFEAQVQNKSIEASKNEQSESNEENLQSSKLNSDSLRFIENQGFQPNLMPVHKIVKQKFSPGYEQMKPIQIQNHIQNQGSDLPSIIQTSDICQQNDIQQIPGKIQSQQSNIYQEEVVSKKQIQEQKKSEDENTRQSSSYQAAKEKGSVQKYFKRSENKKTSNTNQLSIVKKVGIYKLKQNKENFNRPKQIINLKKQSETSSNQDKKCHEGEEKPSKVLRKSAEFVNRAYSPMPKYKTNNNKKISSPYLSSGFSYLKLGPKKQNALKINQDESNRDSSIEKFENILQSLGQDDQNQQDHKKLKKESLAKRKKNCILNEQKMQKLKNEYKQLKIKEQERQQQKVQQTPETIGNLNVQLKNRKSELNTFVKSHSPHYSKSETDQFRSTQKKRKQSTKKIKRTSYGVGKRRDDEVHEYISEARRELQKSEKCLVELDS